jgi:ribokinase
MVSVVGNLNIDLLVRGLAALPEWGREVEASGHARVVAGQAGNLALALVHLDVPVAVISAVGADQAGDQILAALSNAGVATDGVEVIADEPTGLSVALIREDGERAFVSNFGASYRVDADLVGRHRVSVQQDAMLCLVGLMNLPTMGLGAARDLLAEVRKWGVTTVLDTGWDPGDWPPETVQGTLALLKHVDVFLPNLDEAEVLTGTRDPAAAARALAARGPATVVVKCGATGSHGRQGDRDVFVPSVPATVVDAVGAGDSFDAGFLAATLAGVGLQEAMVHGNALASLYIARSVDRFPSATEVAQRVSERTLRDAGAA